MYFDIETIGPEIKEALAAGSTPGKIILDLCIKRGYALHIAQRIFAACVTQAGNGGIIPSQTPGSEVPCPHPIFDQVGGFLLDNRLMRVALAHVFPPIYLIENVVSDNECTELIRLAKKSSRPSLLVMPEGGEAIYGNHGRENSTTPLQEYEGSIGVVLLKRFSALVQRSASCCEGIEVQHYKQGQSFALHVDYLTPHMLKTNPQAIQSGNCIGNLIVYLNEPRLGGSTYFANLGLEVAPRKGAALFFSYPTQDALSMTLHAGNPVIEGEKFIATTVFRERPWKRDYQFE